MWSAAWRWSGVLRRSLPGLAVPKFVRWGITFVFATVLWVFFRADSFDTAGQILTAMAGAGGSLSSLNPLVVLGELDQLKFFGKVVVLVVGAAGFFAVIFPDTYQIMGRNYGLNTIESSFRFIRWRVGWTSSLKYSIAVSVILVLSLTQLLLRADANQFIYFEF